MSDCDAFAIQSGSPCRAWAHRFISALLTAPSLDSAAVSVGIARTTAWRWLQDPMVAEGIRDARRDAMQHVIARLQAAAGAVVECLCEVQRCGESESSRVAASRIVLELSFRAVEIGDVQQRLDAIERAIKSRGRGDRNDARQGPTAA